MDAYEQSRPLTAVKAYMASLTEEQMCASSELLFAQIDNNIQSKEDACAVICEAVSDQISYVKKASGSFSEQQNYLLRAGKQTIGQFTIVPTEEGRFGFKNWTVSSSSFDFSYLLSEPISVTVPPENCVKLNGTVLDNRYIVQQDVEYEALEEFYGKYSLPTLVTYEVDSFIGELEFEILDRDGEPVIHYEDGDYTAFLPACSDETSDSLKGLIDAFIPAYVIYTGGANGYSPAYNYRQVEEYLIRGSELAKRMYTAIDGLQYAQSQRDSLKGILVNQTADIGEGRYFCDVTYIVETVGREGAVETTNNLKLIILETENGLKIEAMTRY
jgi:hypothetical protein